MKLYGYMLLAASASTLEATQLRGLRPGATGGDIDCDAGCDLQPRKVCGEDGFTYHNECLAICQVRKDVSTSF